MGWQDISTAPKDGTTILGFGPYLSEPITAQWRKERQREGWFPTYEGSRIVTYMSDFGPDYADAEHLIYWMPIPTPPKPE